MINDFKSFLKRYKLKATPGRIKLLQFLTSAKYPMSIKQIGKAIGSKYLNQATIYRILEIYKTLCIVRTIDFKQDLAYYELATTDHHHIICKNCGRVEDFVGCNSPQIIKIALKQSKNFKVINEHYLELFGYCKNCISN